MNGYRVYRAEGNAALALITNEALSKETLTYTDEGLTNGSEYRYSVRSVSSSGAESNDSNIRLATPLAPPADPVLTVTPDDTRITLTWPVPSANNSATHYRIERQTRTYRTNPDGTYQKDTNGRLIPITSNFEPFATIPLISGSQRLAPGTMLTYVDPVNNSADYRYRARAVNANGTESANSVTAPPLFHRHANGVTILCPFATFDGRNSMGDIVTGVDAMGNKVTTTYTKRAKSGITDAMTAAGSCTTGITDMSSLISSDSFSNTATFNADISHWDTSRVTTMSSMFDGASVFNQNIGSWNVAMVTNMSNMFKSAAKFDQDIGNWNVAAVTNMSSMFNGTSEFNKDISRWNVGAVTDMSSMFASAESFVQNIGGWNVAMVMNMSGMFIDASMFNQDISRWNTARVTDMSEMFWFATNFNQDLRTWCVASLMTRPNAPGNFATSSGFATATTTKHPKWNMVADSCPPGTT